MKKIILTVATILTIGLTSFAQECKSVKVEVDSFTGERTIETDLIVIKDGIYALNKRPYGLIFWIELKSRIFLTLDEGDILYFKFDDNSVLKFPITKLNISDYSATSGYTNSFGFVLKDEFLQSFQDKQIIGIKCSVNEYSLSPKESAALKNNVNCIVNTK